MYAEMKVPSAAAQNLQLSQVLCACCCSASVQCVLSVSLPACLSFIVYLSVCLSISLSLSESFYQSVCLSVSLFVALSELSDKRWWHALRIAVLSLSLSLYV